MKVSAAQKKVIALLCSACVALIYAYFDIELPAVPSHETASEHPTTEQARVVRVVDGDTIIVELNGEEVPVRYIGVDTPETKDPRRPVECFGEEASRRNTELVANMRVTLTPDTSDTDTYGRLLRYVTLSTGTSTLDVGKILIEEGYATTLTIPPDTSRAQLYKQAQQKARESRAGLWGSACASTL